MWFQNDLAEAVGTSREIIGRYERDEIKPSIERGGQEDRRLRPGDRWRLLQVLPKEDRKVVYRIFDSMLTKRKFTDFFKQELAS